MVSGTIMMSDTSFVTNMDVKNTPNIKNSDSLGIVLNLEASLTIGSNTFSRLKPSNTRSIINNTPKVRQSRFLNNSTDGGVINREMIAAISEIESIISFFIMLIMVFKKILPLKLKLLRKILNDDSIKEL
jgi:hypothetical protein